MKNILAVVLTALCLSVTYGFYTLSNISLIPHQEDTEKILKESKKNRLINKGKEALKYCKDNNMNTDMCILVDYSVHSGKKRLFLYNFEQNRVMVGGLVSHGCGDNPWTLDFSKTSPKFSNVKDSHLSSLGKYKIGDRGWSGFGVGTKYRLHGLDLSNSNAYKRDIVFHSWREVTDKEVYPKGTAEGWGCPAISNLTFQKIDAHLKKANKPVLMWVFNK